MIALSAWRFLVGFLLCLAFTGALVHGQAMPSPAAAPPIETVFLARTATGRGAYHFGEVFQRRGRWVIPDVGYIDFDNAREYREVFAGVGRVFLQNDRLTVMQTEYIAATSGSRAGGAVYWQPYTLVSYRPRPRIASDAVYFPYIPIGGTGRIQHVMQRAKVEVDFARLRIGIGYGANKPAGDAPWRHKPFLTTTIKSARFGNVELWLQRLPGNHGTVQVRYARTLRHE